MLEQRLDVFGTDPASFKAVLAMEKYVRNGSLDASLRNLIKIRASQINGCAFCLDMHNKEAIDAGEDSRRLFVLSAWREAPDLYTAREQAAIALTESVTRIGEAGVPDEVWNRVTAEYSDQEIVELLMVISAINVWNRLAVATHQYLPERE